MKTLKIAGVLTLVVLCLLFYPHRAEAFDFSRPEIRLVEDGFGADLQNHATVVFDENNHVHTVFEDNRNVTTGRFYGTTLTKFNEWVGSYPVDHGDVRPFLLPSSYFPTRVYCGGIIANAGNFSLEFGHMDMGSLPAPPTPTFPHSVPLPDMISDSFRMIGKDFLFYIYETPVDLRIGMYSEQTETFETEYSLEPPDPLNQSFTSPAIAIDDEGFIYVAYSVYYSGSNTSKLVIRRSHSQYAVESFADEREVDFDTNGHPFIPDLAVIGSYDLNDLKVMIAYAQNSSAPHSVRGRMEENGIWNVTMPGSLGGWGPYDISGTLSGTSVKGPDIVYDKGGSLYVVWADDRLESENFHLYGNVSHDGGVSMLSTEEINILGINGLTSTPRIDAGPFYPGDIAIAYCRQDGAEFSPFLLLSRATFFDTCDQDPGDTGFWTSHAGVDVDTNVFFSPPASYRMATGKGTLLSDFGQIEQQGSISLQFFDTGSTTEDFYIALRNDNTKGIIRMLGVRNDISEPDYYGYSLDGINWIATDALRSNGWHEFSLTVNNSGLVMQIDLQGGGTTPVTDPTFTSFTAIELEGGSDTSPYFVDDILVESYPADYLVPPPIPALSQTAVALLLLALGVFMIRRR